MSNSDIRVVPGPANYFSHPGSLERLSDFFSADQLSRAVWVYGERALAGAEPFLPAAFHLPEAKKILFTGHCSERDVAGLVQASGDDRAVVIGVGGGALLDSAKVLARRLGVPLVAIPTIAATCAAWTPLSVWYSDAGQALNFEIFDDANFLVLVEPRIILNAPAEYLLAGIGDTLANGMRPWCWRRSRRRCRSPCGWGLTARWRSAMCCWPAAKRRWRTSAAAI